MEQNQKQSFKSDYFGFQEGAKRLEEAMKGIPDRIPVYAQMHEFTMHELGIPAKTFYTTPEILTPATLEIAERYGIDVGFVDYDVYNIEAEVLVLGHTIEEFSQLEPFNQTEFIYTDLPYHAQDPKLTLLWPYVTPSKRVVDSQIRPIPPGQLAVRRGARVRATDGPVGRVDEFLVDSENCYITHLVLRAGNLLGKKSVTIPVSEIDRIEEKVVHLKIDKKAVKLMPTIKVKRLW